MIDPDDITKILVDLATFGQVAMKDGEHVPLSEIYHTVICDEIKEISEKTWNDIYAKDPNNETVLTIEKIKKARDILKSAKTPY